MQNNPKYTKSTKIGISLLIVSMLIFLLDLFMINRWNYSFLFTTTIMVISFLLGILLIAFPENIVVDYFNDKKNE